MENNKKFNYLEFFGSLFGFTSGIIIFQIIENSWKDSFILIIASVALFLLGGICFRIDSKNSAKNFKSLYKNYYGVRWIIVFFLLYFMLPIIFQIFNLNFNN